MDRRVMWLAAALVALQAPAAAAQPAASPAMESPAAYLKLIADLRGSGRPRAALAHLDAYQAKHPRDGRAQVLRGDCLTDVGQYAEAEAAYRSQIKGPEAASAYRGLGRVAGLRDDWKAAVEAFEQAVRRAPIEPAYVSDLGFAQLRSGDTAGAIFRLRQAAELAPEDAVIRNNLILALEAGGETEAAKRLLAQVKDPADLQAIAAMKEALRGSTAER